jgi:hypothetical protein
MAASRLADGRYGDGYVASDHAVRLRLRLLHADKKQQPRMFTFSPAAAAALCMPQSLAGAQYVPQPGVCTPRRCQ